MNIHKRWVGLGATIVLTLASLTPSMAQSTHHAPEQNAQPFQHVYVIMMENQGTAQIVNNPQLPYINQLIQSYGYENNYYGVTHESLVNYIASITGNNWGSNSDDPTQVFNHTSVADQLIAHRDTWKGYMQSMPYPGYAGYWYPDNLPVTASASQTPPNALYAAKHNPFFFIPSIRNTKQNLNLVPFHQLATDLATNHVPNFAWISPNVINDMHGQPPGPGATAPYSDPSALYAAGDAFVKSTVNKIMDSKSFKTSKSVIYIVWDESEYPSGTPTEQETSVFTAPGPDSPILPAGQVDGFINWSGGAYGGGQVPLIIIDSAYPHHFVIHTWADHYNLLRTIEKNFNLGYLGNASDQAQVKSLTLPNGSSN